MAVRLVADLLLLLGVLCVWGGVCKRVVHVHVCGHSMFAACAKVLACYPQFTFTLLLLLLP